jgi:hypothetical protein
MFEVWRESYIFKGMNMAYVIRNPGHPLVDEDIRVLEKKIGADLPADYREFLIRNNGGRPDPRFFPIRGFKNNPFGQVQDFLGIDDPVEACRLDWKYKTFRGRIPANLFPIASEDGGSLICISLAGPDRGHVYYWNYYGETRPPTYDNVYFIAETFQSFLDCLQFHDPLAEVD